MKFHHLGIACKDLVTTKEWVKANFSIVQEIGPVTDHLQNASFFTLRTKDGVLIEVIAGEQVVNVLKRGINLYHMCYAVEDLDAAIKGFEANGALVISKPKPSTLFLGKMIAFLNTPIGIIELLEDKSFVNANAGDR